MASFSIDDMLFFGTFLNSQKSTPNVMLTVLPFSISTCGSILVI